MSLPYGPAELSLLLLVAVVLPTRVGGQEEIDPSAAPMAAAAHAFVAALDDDQRTTALLPFTAEERQDWHYIPKRERKGLSFKAMTSEQVHLAHVLLNASLSRIGYGKAATIMSLESLVRQIDERAGRSGLILQLRDPFLYYVTLFGTPSTDADWGWSIEGHHLSLNFTVVGGKVIATSPAFYGAEPHEIDEGPRKGLRVLAREEDLARALLASLDADQRRAAILAEEAPRDIFSAAEREVAPELPAKGVAATALRSDQKELLRALVETYIHNLPPDLAAKRQQQLEAAGDDLHFVWMGALERGPGKGHYYRVQAPTFLIEYDNIQNDANHSHTVWRDYEGDFGRDLLAEHYARHH